MTENKIKKRTGPKFIITIPKFKQALKGTIGIISAVSKNLNVERKTVYSFIERHNLKYLVDEEREKLIDTAEVELVRKVKQGDWKAIDKVLSTLGKERGYVERKEVVNSGNINVGILPLNESERNELLIDLKESK